MLNVGYMMNFEDPYLVKVENLSFSYQNTRILKDVSFSILPGQTFGLLGNSGSGKTTLGKLLWGLYLPDSGTITYADSIKDSLTKDVQMVFQNPYSSLNPRMTVKEIIQEPLYLHNMQKDIGYLMDFARLDKSLLYRYPHELSGGQRQRVAIIRSIVLEPKLVILDEPVSALDVSIQGQIINLLKDIQKETQVTYVFISHDLALVKYMSDEIYRVYKGQLVPSSQKEYTEQLEFIR